MHGRDIRKACHDVDGTLTKKIQQMQRSRNERVGHGVFSRIRRPASTISCKGGASRSNLEDLRYGELNDAGSLYRRPLYYREDQFRGGYIQHLRFTGITVSKHDLDFIALIPSWTSLW